MSWDCSELKDCRECQLEGTLKVDDWGDHLFKDILKLVLIVESFSKVVDLLEIVMIGKKNTIMVLELLINTCLLKRSMRSDKMKKWIQ